MAIIDVDGHVFEPRNLWRQYCDPGDREVALSIEDDALGYPWLTYQGRTAHGAMAFVTEPGARTPEGAIDTSSVAERYRACYAGEPATASYEELMDPAFHEAGARAKKLDEWGVDEAVVFPQWALDWESMFFLGDWTGLQANARAWNRFAGEFKSDGGGRLHPVGHLTLQGDRRWLFEELDHLERAGIRMAMATPGLIDGKRPSHPDNDEIWRALVDHGITLTHHITSGAPYMIDPAWVENDNPFLPAVGLGFYTQQTHLPLTDMAINGVFHRHPDLRIALIEESAILWLEKLLATMDMAYQHTAYTLGRSVNPDLELKPSEYVLRQCRFGILAGEEQTAKVYGGGRTAGLIETSSRLGDVFCFGGDWPHPEGSANPVGDFTATLEDAESAAISRLWHDNSAWLLQRT